MGRRRRVAEWAVVLLLVALYAWIFSRPAIAEWSWSVPPSVLLVPPLALALLGVRIFRPQRRGTWVALGLCGLVILLLGLCGLTQLLLPGGHPPAAVILLIPLVPLGQILGVIVPVLVVHAWTRGEPWPSAAFMTVLFLGASVLVPRVSGAITESLARLPGAPAVTRTLHRIDPRCPELEDVRNDPVLLRRCPGLDERRAHMFVSLAADGARFGSPITERLHDEWSTLRDPKAIAWAVMALQHAHPKLLPDEGHPLDSYALLCTMVGEGDAPPGWAIRGALESRLMLAATEARYAECLAQLLAGVTPRESGLGVCQAVLGEAHDEEARGVPRASIDARLVPLRPYAEKARGAGRCDCEVLLARIDGRGGEALAVELANRRDPSVARCLEFLGPAAAAAVEPLRSRAGAGNVWTRLEAIRALGSIQAREARDPLIALLSDPDQQIRAGARSALDHLHAPSAP